MNRGRGYCSAIGKMLEQMMRNKMRKFTGIFLPVAFSFCILFNLTAVVAVVYGYTSVPGEGRILAGLTAEVTVREGAAPVFSGGSGSVEDPYLIAAPEQLHEVRNYLSSCFELCADLDLACEPFSAGEGWAPIGAEEAPFTGMLDGKGYLIKNLFIRRTTINYRYIGLFAVAQNAVFKNICLENADIQGYKYVGGVVGHNAGGIIDACCATGNITGLGYCVGGLAGFNGTGSQINNSCSKCSVKGIGSSAGGLAGENYGSVANSYAAGSVEGTNAGGLLWSNYGAVDKCYAAGSVTSNGMKGGLVASNFSSGTVAGSCWDKDTTGQATSSGGGGPLTTAAMKLRESYTGWDFTDIWDIIDGETYPCLRWQNADL